MPAGPAAGEPQTEARPFPHGGAGVTRMAACANVMSLLLVAVLDVTACKSI